jgi:hypothetical protein
MPYLFIKPVERNKAAHMTKKTRFFGDVGGVFMGSGIRLLNEI